MQFLEKDFRVLMQILSAYPYKFYLFGSRSKNTARAYSDVDICYFDDIPDLVHAQILADFDESDFPFKVDLVSSSHMSEDFRRSIAADLKLLSKRVIAVSGASGFIGSALVEALQKRGYEVWGLRLRGEPGEIDVERLASCYAVINLAGSNLMGGLWTKKFRRLLIDSRLKTTEALARGMIFAKGPRIFLSASAIGFYGDGGERDLDEQSPQGQGFLARLCGQWEGASKLAKDAGIRVVNLRTGIVLGAGGGMLAILEPLYKMGLGGPLGSGKQFMAPIALKDAVAAIIFALEHDELSGPLNLVGPTPITSQDFSRCLALSLKRSACLRVPQAMLKLLGDQGQMLLASSRVVPARLLAAGFKFSYTNTQDALKAIYK